MTAVRTARAVLELGRVSNLPTVWANCVAAWMLTGGSIYAPQLWFSCLAGSLVYVAGTVLNDAFDTEFDAEHRKDRPIPSGRISRQTTWLLGGGALAFGVAIFLGATFAHPLFVGALAVAVVIYDWTHKRSIAGPWIMGACRFLLYLTVASGAPNGHAPDNALIVGAAAGIYVVGLSYVARGEATGAKLLRWPLGLLAVPILVGLYATFGLQHPLPYCVLFVFCIWIGIALAILTDQEKADRVGKAVGFLLAGLVLFDALMLSYIPVLVPFLVATFLLTLVLQRFVPAT